MAWVAGLTGTPARVIAIDGKTSRRSGRKGAREALHTVSAFAARERLVLAQVKTDAKSNEITAIPALLDLHTWISKLRSDFAYQAFVDLRIGC